MCMAIWKKEEKKRKNNNPKTHSHKKDDWKDRDINKEAKYFLVNAHIIK